MNGASLGLAPSQGWEAYSYLLIASLLGFFAPACLSLASRIIRSRKAAVEGNPELDEAHIRERERMQSELGERFNTRVYVGVNLAVSFLGVVLLILPWVFEVRGGDGRVFALVFSVSALLGLCIWYSSRNGDLNWSTDLEVDR